MSKESERKAEEFLSISSQFKLGSLVTEASHPITKDLSSLAKNNLPKAISSLKELDDLTIGVLTESKKKIYYLKDCIRDTIESGNNVYFCGCGSTGRLSLTIETIWRQVHADDELKDRVFSFMSGGDVALICSIENFEDYPQYGARQLVESGFKDGDLMVGSSEGGETAFVIGAVEKAAEISKRKQFFLYCNPDEILCQVAERSKSIIQNPKVEKIILNVGPMGVTGSTRMQSSTILLAAEGIALLYHNDTNDNITRAFMVKINQDENMSKLVTAYNGEYVKDENGKSVPMYPNSDNYLRIESNIDGLAGEFEGRFSVERKAGADITAREVIYNNDKTSQNSVSDTILTIYEDKLELKSGSMKAQIENLASSNPNDKFQSYLDKLDSIAQTLSDTYSAYIRVGSEDYIYGKDASDAYNNPPFPQNGGDIINLNLFSGSSVKDLKFNTNQVNYLNQQNVDYLATLQWKSISFNGGAQDPNNDNSTSFVEFYRTLKVGLSTSKEEAAYSFEVQDSIAQNLGEAYNKVVKVDSDEQMLDLMRFQASFSANAQVITAVDSMIQTLLGMKR